MSKLADSEVQEIAVSMSPGFAPTKALRMRGITINASAMRILCDQMKFGANWVRSLRYSPLSRPKTHRIKIEAG
ncbi:MAG: hypothetical protein WCI11_20540, partial [Candidatus Methylumidiphilus sp.]